MQTLTAEQKAHLYEGGFVGVTITAHPIEGEPYISQDDIVQDTFKIERNWTNGSNIEIDAR